jgi:hypothetical protein
VARGRFPWRWRSGARGGDAADSTAKEAIVDWNRRF